MSGRRTPSQARPVGSITRGTTAPNRLRRVDRWIAGALGGLLRHAEDPLVVDLGYGASGVTTAELHTRLQRVRPDIEVIGMEIDPERVAAATDLTRPGLRFVRGGFELGLPDGRRPVVVRAFNVLRQYAESEVSPAWALVRERLAPDGVLIDGTCDEIGRRACWVTVAADHGPRHLTVAVRLAGLERPSQVAERLPKALIHRNVPGEGVHALLQAADQAWARQAHRAPFGVRQRWLSTVASLKDDGWPILDRPARWRLGEFTIDWTAVAPALRPPESG